MTNTHEEHEALLAALFGYNVLGHAGAEVEHRVVERGLLTREVVRKNGEDCTAWKLTAAGYAALDTGGDE